MNARALSVLLGGISFLSLPGTRGLLSPHPVTPRRSPPSSWHGGGGSGDSTTTTRSSSSSSSTKKSSVLCANNNNSNDEEQPARQALPRRRRSTSPLFSTKQDLQPPPRRSVPRFGVRSVDVPPARRTAVAARSEQFSRPRPVGLRKGGQQQKKVVGRGGGGVSTGGDAVAKSRESSGRVGEARKRGIPSAMQILRDVSVWRVW